MVANFVKRSPDTSDIDRYVGARTDRLATAARTDQRHQNSPTARRGPAFAGEIIIQTTEVMDKTVDEKGRQLIQVKHSMKSEERFTICTDVAEIQLTKRAEPMTRHLTSNGSGGY